LNGNYGTSKNYILITPCKNEENNITSLINSIIAQSIKPIIWVIVDDGSTDNTQYLLKEAEDKHKWIKILRLEENPRDLGLHLAEVMKKGFDYAIGFCKNTGLEYHYLGNVDADLMLNPAFFEKLIVEFEISLDLGIASGGIILTNNNRLKCVKGLPVDEPSGGDMLIRRICFEECGGIPQSYAYDSVLKARARLNGWKTKRFEDNIVIEARDVGNAEGYFKGFSHMGKASHYLNVHPIHVLARGVHKSLKWPYYGGGVYILSYICSFIKKNKQIDDEEIRNYFWNKWKHVYNRFFTRVIHEDVEKN